MGQVERMFFQLLFKSKINLQSTVIEFVNVTQPSLLQWLMGLNRHIGTQLSFNNTSTTIHSTCATVFWTAGFSGPWEELAVLWDATSAHTTDKEILNGVFFYCFPVWKQCE